MADPKATQTVKNTTPASTLNTATGDISAPATTATVDTTVTSVVDMQPSPVAVDTSAVAPVITEFDAMRTKFLTDGNDYQKQLVHILDEYSVAMAPAVMQDVSSVVRYQTRLWNAIHTVVESTDNTFKTNWSLILAYFDNYKATTFNMLYINRGFQDIQLSSEHIDAFQRLIHLASTTANPETRAAGVKQTDFAKLLKDGLTSVANSNLSSFYAV